MQQKLVLFIIISVLQLGPPLLAWADGPRRAQGASAQYPQKVRSLSGKQISARFNRSKKIESRVRVLHEHKAVLSKEFSGQASTAKILEKYLPKKFKKLTERNSHHALEKLVAASEGRSRLHTQDKAKGDVAKLATAWNKISKRKSKKSTSTKKASPTKRTPKKQVKTATSTRKSIKRNQRKPSENAKLISKSLKDPNVVAAIESSPFIRRVLARRLPGGMKLQGAESIQATLSVLEAAANSSSEDASTSNSQAVARSFLAALADAIQVNFSNTKSKKKKQKEDSNPLSGLFGLDARDAFNRNIAKYNYKELKKSQTVLKYLASSDKYSSFLSTVENRLVNKSQNSEAKAKLILEKLFKISKGEDDAARTAQSEIHGLYNVDYSFRGENYSAEHIGWSIERNRASQGLAKHLRGFGNIEALQTAILKSRQVKKLVALVSNRPLYELESGSEKVKTQKVREVYEDLRVKSQWMNREGLRAFIVTQALALMLKDPQARAYVEQGKSIEFDERMMSLVRGLITAVRSEQIQANNASGKKLPVIDDTILLGAESPRHRLIRESGLLGEIQTPKTNLAEFLARTDGRINEYFESAQRVTDSVNTGIKQITTTLKDSGVKGQVFREILSAVFSKLGKRKSKKAESLAIIAANSFEAAGVGLPKVRNRFVKMWGQLRFLVEAWPIKRAKEFTIEKMIRLESLSRKHLGTIGAAEMFTTQHLEVYTHGGKAKAVELAALYAGAQPVMDAMVQNKTVSIKKYMGAIKKVNSEREESGGGVDKATLDVIEHMVTVAHEIKAWNGAAKTQDGKFHDYAAVLKDIERSVKEGRVSAVELENVARNALNARTKIDQGNIEFKNNFDVLDSFQRLPWGSRGSLANSEPTSAVPIPPFAQFSQNERDHYFSNYRHAFKRSATAIKDATYRRAFEDLVTESASLAKNTAVQLNSMGLNDGSIKTNINLAVKWIKVGSTAAAGLGALASGVGFFM